MRRIRDLLPLAVLVGVAGGCGEPAPGEPGPDSEPESVPSLGQLAVVWSAPADGATGVARAATVTVQFSEPVDPSSVNADSFVLWQEATAVATDLAVEGDVGVLTPRALLEFGVSYTITVSRTVRDTAGRFMPTEYRAVFTTKVNQVP